MTLPVVLENYDEETKDITTLDEARKVIDRAIAIKKNVTLNLSLAPEDFDELSLLYPDKKFYLKLPVILNFPALPKLKSYPVILEDLQRRQLLETLNTESGISHKVKISAGELYNDEQLKQVLSPISKRVTVTYRGTDYPYKEFRSALLYYQVNIISRIEDHFNKVKIQVIEEVKDIKEENNQVAENTNNHSTLDLDFIAIDFETANEKRHSACSIGIVEVKDGNIVKQHYYKIKPEPNTFSVFNSRKHGMKAEDVANELTFKELWPELKSIFEGKLIIAHNAASFDISVLRQSLEYHSLEKIAYSWGCTMRAAEKAGLPKKLKELAVLYDVTLNHHDALSDALACAKIAVRLYQESGRIGDFDITKEMIEDLASETDTEEEIQLNDLDREFINRTRQSI